MRGRSLLQAIRAVSGSVVALLVATLLLHLDGIALGVILALASAPILAGYILILSGHYTHGVVLASVALCAMGAAFLRIHTLGALGVSALVSCVVLVSILADGWLGWLAVLGTTAVAALFSSSPWYSVTSVLVLGVLVEVVLGTVVLEHENTRMALREAEEILNAQADYVLSVDSDGNILYCNDAFRNEFGGIRNISEVCDNALDSLNVAAANKPVLSYRGKVVNKDGEIRWVHWVGSVMRNVGDGGVIVHASGRDITGEVKREMELRRQANEMRRVLEMIADSEKRVIDAARRHAI